MKNFDLENNDKITTDLKRQKTTLNNLKQK